MHFSKMECSTLRGALSVGFEPGLPCSSLRPPFLAVVIFLESWNNLKKTEILCKLFLSVLISTDELADNVASQPNFR